MRHLSTMVLVVSLLAGCTTGTEPARPAQRSLTGHWDGTTVPPASQTGAIPIRVQVDVVESLDGALHGSGSASINAQDFYPIDSVFGVYRGEDSTMIALGSGNLGTSTFRAELVTDSTMTGTISGSLFLPLVHSLTLRRR